MEKEIVKYKYEFEQVNSNAVIQTSSRKINAITFINKSSNNTPTINGYPLEFNESVTLSGNENETDTSIYNIAIPDTGTANLWKITKYNFFE